MWTLGSSDSCSLSVGITDEIPPLLSCKPSSTVLIPDEAAIVTLDPLDFVSSVEQGSRTSSDTGVLRLTVADIGTVKTTRITATDSSGNTAQCSVQVKVEGRSFFLNAKFNWTTWLLHTYFFLHMQPNIWLLYIWWTLIWFFCAKVFISFIHLPYWTASKCQAWTLFISHGQKTCSQRSGNAGIDCVFRCDSGYVFSEDMNQRSVTVSCVSGGDWDREPPTCQGNVWYVWFTCNSIVYMQR